MSDETERKPPIRITTKMRAAFRRGAPAAVSRRNNAYLLSVGTNVVQWLLIASSSLLGLYYWNWTAIDMLLVFVLGVVAAILADGLKWLFARRKLLEDYQKMQDDRLVWVVFEAERRQKEEVAADRLEPRPPGPALLLDICLGTIGIVALNALRSSLGLDAATWRELGDGVKLVMLLVCAAPLVSLLSTLLAGKAREGGYDDLEFRAGGRGIGLLLLAAAIHFFGDGADGARNVMLFIHWATLVAGVMAVLGVVIMYVEREQLRAWLESDEGGAARGKSREGKRGRRS